MSKQYPIDHYEDIDRIEKKHYWFLARNELLKHVITSHISKKGKVTFLEVGCGTGIVIRILETLGLTVTGLDINRKALDYAKIGTHAAFIRQSFLSYKPEKKFDAVGMFDVIEHIFDDRAFIKKSHVVLKKNGLLFLTIPSGTWLWTDLDIAAGHIRRYEPNDLKSKLQQAGFTVVWWNYWGVFTLPFFLLWRKFSVMKLNGSDLEKYFSVPREPMNSILLFLMRLEHRFLFNIKWSKGATIVLVARRN